jgi:hypothetical protein
MFCTTLANLDLVKRKKKMSKKSDSFHADGVGIVDKDNGFLVINPDRLIRVTSIGDAVSCVRRSVLSEKLKVIFFVACCLSGFIVVFKDLRGCCRNDHGFVFFSIHRLEE